eukprot:TRINITY_DN5567_c0_g1_i1.p1 TRINITY_DN5567_c0_g1~~TRINITY_DN5567_c0_g1_i1.p1  ORF type:complete len:451 (-),score=44.13 TRINITY_DN5567_c0_g1_i1:20-1324(-)
MSRIILLLFVAIFFFSSVSSKLVENKLVTNKQWHFVSKFCYSNEGSHGGIGHLNFTFWTHNTHAKVLLYNDNYGQPGSWFQVYGNKKLSCHEKVNKTVSEGVIPILNAKPVVITVTDRSRPYFWYLAVADCEADILDVTYQVSFRNPGGIWKREFSFDEQELLAMYIAFFVFYAIITFIHLVGVWYLRRTNSYHPIVRLLSVAIVSEFVSIIFNLIHYGIYANNGFGSPGLRGTGEILHMMSILFLMLLLILLAKGWAVTSNTVTDKNLMMLIIVAFVLAYVALFIWDNVGRDPASTLYFYDSVPGLLVVLLRVLTLIWFFWCLVKTRRLETNPEKRRFYLFFGLGFGLWFVALPLIVAISLGLPSWWRQKVVDGLILTINVIAYILLTILLWPTRAQKYFSIKPSSILISDMDTSTQTGGYGTSSHGREDEGL